MIGLKAIEFYIPEELAPVTELPEVKKLSEVDAQALDVLQVETVPVAVSLDNKDLAAKAGERAIQEANLSPDDIDLLIYLPGRTPAYFLSSEATAVQEELGLKNCYSFSLTGLGCANISNGLLVAKNYLTANPEMENILICCGSKPISQERYRQGITFIGDGGMGVIVGRTNQNQIIDVQLKTDGKFWDLYKIDYKNKLAEEYTEVCTSPRYKLELAIASRNNFKELNQKICAENQVEKVDGYIMQNLSISAFNFNEEAFGIQLLKSCYTNCQRYGHLGSIDVLLNYRDGLRNGELKTGDQVLIMNNSSVACWSTILIKV